MRSELISIAKFNSLASLLWRYLLSKNALFLSLLVKYWVKTRKHEFTDIIHQNKQGIDGKKRSGKEFIAFEQHVLDSSRVG